MKNNTYTVKSFKEFVKANKFAPQQAVVTKDYEIVSNENGSTFKITEESHDREQDVVFAKGLDITNFLKNPVVLWGHDSHEPPIGKCVNIDRVEDGWVATVEFVPADNPYNGYKAEGVRQMIKDGFLHAVSIGFIPKEWDFNDEGGFDITESELTEFSVVSVPCNPNALVTERSLNTTEPLIPEDVNVHDDEEIEEEDQEQAEENEKEAEKARKIKKLRFDRKKFN